MVAPDLVLAFTAASFLLIVVPGPMVLFVISRALAYGRKVVLTTVLGGTAGTFVLGAAVALGVGAIVQTSVVVFTAMKLLGAAYLIHLGIRAFRHRRALREAFDAAEHEIGRQRTWWEAFAVGLTNPKTVIFFAAILPQFVDPARAHASLQMLLLCAIFCTLALMLDAVWGLAAGTVRDWFARSPRRLDLIGGAAGLTMVGLGVGLAATGRRE